MMKIDVIEEKDNPFLKRKDLMLMVDHSGQATPKKEDLIQDIAKKFKSDPEKIRINYIFTQVGLSKSRVKARIYREKPPKEKVKKKEVKPEKKPKEEKVEKKPEEKEEVKKVEEKSKEETKPEKKVEKEEKPKEEVEKKETKPEEKPKEEPEKEGEGGKKK